MKMIRDRTGRFPLRPHYEINELECESIIESFLFSRYVPQTVPKRIIPSENGVRSAV
jgi:hypothetical protein